MQIQKMIFAEDSSITPKTRKSSRCRKRSIFVCRCSWGNETTNFLANAMLRTLGTPGLVGRMRADPSLTPDVIAEVLRSDSPLQGLFRIALEDHDFDGVKASKGAKLMVCFGSANRDEKYYGDGQFDPERDHRSTIHLAFGRRIRTCAGQGFARREGVLAIDRLLERLPDLRVLPIAKPVRQMLFGIRGMKRLNPSFTPTASVKNASQSRGMTMEIHVDMTLFEYHGLCTYFAPEVFKIDDDRLVYVAEPDESLRDKVTKAARAGPQLAIKIVE